MNKALAKCTPWCLGDFMGLFYLQVSKRSLAQVHGGGYSWWGEKKHTASIHFTTLAPQQSILQVWVPEPFYPIANGTLTKVLPVQSCWILSHSWDISLKAKLDNSAVLCRVWKFGFTLAWSET